MLVRRPALFLAALGWMAPLVGAQVEGFKLSKINGGVGIQPEGGGNYGQAVVSLGDLDGDGFEDLAVGEPQRDDGGTDRGAVWIHFRRADGTVRQSVRLSQTSGGFGGTLADEDRFGSALAAPGDLNGDGVQDLFVGAPANGGGATGAIWAVYLDNAGQAVGHLRISENEGGLFGQPTADSGFGGALCTLGDVDGDGTDDLAVGSASVPGGIFGGSLSASRVWILFLQPGGQGAVRDWQLIRDGVAGFEIPFGNTNEFGAALVSPGDLDGNGVPDLVVGNPGYEFIFTIGNNVGEAYVLFLSSVGTVDSFVIINPNDVYPGFTWSRFADGMALLDDEDLNGLADIAIGMSNSQVLARVSLNASGAVVASQSIGAINLEVESSDRFATSFTAMEDGDGDGEFGLAIGAPADDDGGANRGALWIVNEGPGDGVPNLDFGTVVEELRVGEGQGGFGGTINENSLVGSHQLAVLGDVDANGAPDFAWGVPRDDDGGNDRGAVFVVLMNTDGTVLSETKIGSLGGGLVKALGDDAQFGRSLAAIGDRDGNGVPDLLVGAIDQLSAPTKAGFFVLYLGADGSVVGERWIADGASGFAGGATTHASFGGALTRIGDLDGDGQEEWAAGSVSEEASNGAVYVLFTQADESIASWTRLILGSDGLPAPDNFSSFGFALTSMADLNSDGRRELAVGTPGLNEPNPGSGAVFLLFPDATGVPSSFVKYSGETGDASGSSNVDVGEGLGTLADLDGDGSEELLVLSDLGFRLLDLGAGGVVEGNSLYRPGTRGLEFVGALGPGLAGLDLEADGVPEVAVINRGEFPYEVALLRFQERLARSEVYGCPAIPAGSLSVVSGEAVIGGTLGIAIDNPVGTQAGPAVPILIFGSAPLDCGDLAVPGWGMGSPGSDGDVLIQALVPLFYRLGPIWNGGGPSTLNLGIPHDSGLVGGTVYLQGILWEPAASLGIEYALTEALDLRIGTADPDPSL